jgi:hypothetical protein
LGNIFETKLKVLLQSGGDVWREVGLTCFWHFQQNWGLVYKKYLCVNTPSSEEGNAAIMQLAVGVDATNRC